MSLIEKIDEMKAQAQRLIVNNPADRLDEIANDISEGYIIACDEIKAFFLAEQNEPIGNTEEMKEPCKGCIHDGNYENELEYGYPSPCTQCKRRCMDNYLNQPYME